MSYVLNPFTGDFDFFVPPPAPGGPFQPLDADLTAISALAGTGVLCRTAADSWALRTVVDAGSGRVSITNPGGVAGSITLDVVEAALSLGSLSGQVDWPTQIDFTGSDLADLVTRLHADLQSIGPDDHHAQSHVLATNLALGVDHTISGATAGHVLRASGATTALFAQLQHVDLGGVGANDHHAQSHVLATNLAHLLYLAGRSGTGNDAILSTSTDGTLLGSSASGKALILDAGAGSDGVYRVVMCPSLNAYVGNMFLFETAHDVTLVTGSAVLNAHCISEHGSWLVQVDLASGFGLGARGYVFAPNIFNDANRADMGLYSAFLTTGNVYAVTGTTISAGSTAMLFDAFVVGSSLNAGTLTWTSHATLLCQTTMAGGTGTAALTTRRGVWYKAVSGGTPINAIALDVEAEVASTLTAAVRSTITSGTGKWFLLSTATANSSFGGNLFVGSVGSVVPTATIHARHPTITNEVSRFESTTSGTPAVVSEVRRQGRVTTTNNTQTTLMSYTLTAARAYLIEARVTGHRTGGTAGAADDSAAYVIYAGAKHTGGAAALITAVGADYTDEDQAGWDATLDVNGNDVRVRVTGATNNNVTWHCTLVIQEVGT